MTYDSTRLPLRDLLIPIARAGDAIARLDDRVGNSAVHDGWIERAHFTDAAASLYLDGELVSLEDLVLHDAHMDIRSPTHELAIAHAVLVARRQISANAPDWATSTTGLSVLRGRNEESAAAPERKDILGMLPANEASGEAISVEPIDAFDAELAAIDALLVRSQTVLNGASVSSRQAQRDTMIYDEDWDEEARLAEWRKVALDTVDLPPVLRAALLLDAWSTLEVLQHSPWLGRLLAAAILRHDGTTEAHLLAINTGLRDIRWERRRARDRKTRLIAFLDGIEQAGRIGLRDHDRLMAARGQLERRLSGRRSNSKLPQLVELVLARPLVSTGMIARELKVTPQGAVGLATELGLREMTGRGRYRAWGVL